MDISIKARRRGRCGLRSTSVALWAVAAAASAQTAPIGTTRPAEYDCSGLAGVALTSCRQLNADAVKGATLHNDASVNTTHDCAGMTGGALATCRDLNGAPNAVAPGVAGAGGAYGGVPSLPTGSQVVPSQPADGTTANTATQTTTLIPQQTTGGTNPITPSGTGAMATTGGANPITPSGTGAMGTTGGTNPIVPSGTGTTAGPGGTNPTAPSGTGTTAPTAGTSPVPPSGTGTITFSDGTTVVVPSGTGASTSTTVPSATMRDSAPVKGGQVTTAPGRVSPPSDVVVPMSGASGTSAPAGAAPAPGGARSGK